MDVGWAHRVTVEQVQKLVGWAVGGKRVGSWSQADEAVFTVGVGLELSSQVVVLLVLLVLEIVLSVGRRLPEVDCDVGDWLLGGHVTNDTVHECDLTARGWAVDDALLELSPWSIRAPEWTKNGGGGRAVAGL